MISQASPTASAPLEQADVAQKFIPFAPSMMDTCPAAASAIIMGTSRGLIRRGPFSARVAIWAESVVMPAYAAADQNADIGAFFLAVQVGLLHCLHGGHRGELGVAVHAAGFTVLEVLGRVETLHLGGDPGLEGSRRRTG